MTREECHARATAFLEKLAKLCKDEGVTLSAVPDNCGDAYVCVHVGEIDLADFATVDDGKVTDVQLYPR